jgi:hypothetical protein
MGMDTEEMYRRGVADAEHGEPHPFYYQHYYQYRRGYDRTRRRLGLPGGFEDARRRRAQLVGLVVVLLALGAAGYVWRGRAQPSTARAPETAPTSFAVTAVPTRTPIFATPTLEPTAAAPTLHVGGSATVANTQGAALRGREQPGTKARVTASFREGDQVAILEGPVEADGFVWWRIEGKAGAGWSAQQSKEGVAWLQPLAAP